MLKQLASPKLFWLDRLVPNVLLRRIILALPFKHIQKGRLTLNLYQDSFRFAGEQGGRQAELTIINPTRTYWLLATQGEIGFAQAYYEGVVDTSSLVELMHLAHDNREAFSSLFDKKGLNVFKLWQHRNAHNSVVNSKKNISFHYDLGNAFYQKWLDETMSYSSAVFNDDTHTLEQAQHNKYLRLTEFLDLQAGDRVLEIGCGWGGLMAHLLEQGVRVKGLTLSAEQQHFAQQRLQSFASRDYEVSLQDYRHEMDQFDHIVSIEMFEAVGKEYWETYFAKLNQCLKPGGKAALQVITIDDEYAQSYQEGVDFIQAYIFPGGLLPSKTQVKNLAQAQNMHCVDEFSFGPDYAVTCHLWKKSFNRYADELETMGYDRSFQRLWNYYLDYCIVGFETGHISVEQFVFAKPDKKQ